MSQVERRRRSVVLSRRRSDLLGAARHGRGECLALLHFYIYDLQRRGHEERRAEVSLMRDRDQEVG